MGHFGAAGVVFPLTLQARSHEVTEGHVGYYVAQ